MHRLRVHCDLESEVRGHLMSSKVALFDRTHTTLYSSSIVTMPLSITVSEIQPHFGVKSLIPCLPPVRGETVRLTQQPLVKKKTRLMGLSDSERISVIRKAVLIQSTRVTGRRTDGWTELPWHIRAI